jgi:DNA-binding MarR family transcriptional regulator
VPQVNRSAPPADSAADLDYGILPDLVGYHLRRAQVTVFGDFAQSVADFRITPGQFGVLTLVGRNPGLSQSALARAVSVERSTMVAVIDGLEARRLIERQASPVDRRSYALVLTDKGRKLLRELEKVVMAHDRRATENLSESERATLIRLLARLNEPR